MNILLTKIEFLKMNIQEIITLNTNDDILQNKKETYMKNLDETMIEYKALKTKLRLDNEYKKVLRTSDSRFYYRVKNKPNVKELMNELKDNREKAQHDFEKMKIIETEYNDKENKMCKSLPAYLFFHKTIIDKYGSCEFIKFDIEDIDFNNRLEWLNNTTDHGELYYNLYDKIENECENKLYINNKLYLEEFFDKMHNSYLTENQYKLLKEIMIAISEYNKQTIKTKKLKEKFNLIINNTSILVSETNLKINEYLSDYFKLYIPINITKNIIYNVSMCCSKEYDEKLNEYKKVIEDIEISKKYIFNTKNNLKQELYLHFYNMSIKKIKITQKGKYFKKWNLLTTEDKIDRYESFVEYFIDKFLVEPELIDNNKATDLKKELKELLKSEIKNIKYKNIKWDTTLGIIEQIKSLKYDDEKQIFYFVKDKAEIVKPRKASSIRSILNKETEKVINEELVLFIIKSKNNNKSNIKELKEECIDVLKTKLKLKRITVNDKIDIHKKFDNIYNVILNNNADKSPTFVQ